MAHHDPKLRKKGWKIDLVRAKSGDEITWTHNGGKVTISFPPEGDPFGIEQVTLAPGGQKSLTVKVTEEVAPGTYPYSVFCAADNEYAEGDSPPRIIIED